MAAAHTNAGVSMENSDERVAHGTAVAARSIPTPRTYFFTAGIRHRLLLEILIVDYGTSCLRSFCRNCWRRSQAAEWDNATSGRTLLSKLSNKDQKQMYDDITKSFETGNMEMWDISILVRLINLMFKIEASKPQRERKLDPCLKEAVDGLKKRRNWLMHQGQTAITEEDFELAWREVRTLLVCLVESEASVNDEMTRILSAGEDILAAKTDFLQAEFEVTNSERRRYEDKLRVLNRTVQQLLNSLSQRESVESSTGNEVLKACNPNYLLPSMRSVPSDLSSNELTAQSSIFQASLISASLVRSEDREGSEDTVWSEASTSTDSESEDEVVSVHCSGPVADSTACMRLLEAYAMKKLSEELQKIFKDSAQCKKTDAALAEVINDFVKEGIISMDRSSAEAPGRPAVEVLYGLVEKGWTGTAESLKAWQLANKRVEIELKFYEMVNQYAKDSMFSVERAVATLSHVAFLRMTRFGAAVLSYMLEKFPDLLEACDKIGINLIVFGREELGVFASKPSCFAPQRALQYCVRQPYISLITSYSESTLAKSKSLQPTCEASQVQGAPKVISKPAIDDAKASKSQTDVEDGDNLDRMLVRRASDPTLAKAVVDSCPAQLDKQAASPTRSRRLVSSRRLGKWARISQGWHAPGPVSEGWRHVVDWFKASAGLPGVPARTPIQVCSVASADEDGRQTFALSVEEERHQISALSAEEEQHQISELSAEEERHQISALSVDEDGHQIERVFRKYQQDSPGPNSFKHIPFDVLPTALKELHVHVNEGEVAELFRTMDLNDDGLIDLDEFRRAVLKPSVVEEWARSLPLAKLLSKALTKFSEQSSGRDPLFLTAELTQAQINDAVQVFCGSLQPVLQEHISKLKHAFAVMTQKTNAEADDAAAKFEIVKLSCGSIEDFHAGLQKRVGACHLDFENGMEAEHCSKANCDYVFTTSNSRVTSTPKQEWNVIVLKTEVVPENMRGGRKIPDIDALLELEVAKKPKLRRSEVIAVVLYTGPMYYLYNCILRRYPKEIYELFKASENLFQTTIFVLASAVQKISRVMKLPQALRLYRGLGGTLDLPDSFFKSDEHGCKGFAEWGFMSTTSDKSVAIKYSWFNQTKAVPYVFEIHVGAVDRGASIRDFSQYADEVEYLFVPCSFLEQDGPSSLEVTYDGVVKIFPAKVNANLKTPTLEELVGQKHSMHIAAFTSLIDEIDRDLHEMAVVKDAAGRLDEDTSKSGSDSVEGFLARIVQQCKDVLAQHQAINPDDYANGLRFRSLVLEMFDVKMMAMAKLEEWLENRSSSFIRYRWNAALRTVHRRWTAYLDRTLESCPPKDKKNASLKLCQQNGLLVHSVDEKNELNETKLMAAAAEGKAKRVLMMLVDAGADVKQARPDGVTAIWLAAQFGHTACVLALAEMKADVNQQANDGATPVYIAAQSGNVECIKQLVALNADVNLCDGKGLTPAHQAAMNGHEDTLKVLVELRADIHCPDVDGKTPLDHAKERQRNWRSLLTVVGATNRMLSRAGSKKPRRLSLSTQARSSKLIVSTGDLGDIDGFFALVEYAKTGADVLFIMNYPAYIGVNPEEVDDKYAERNPGLGYRYSAREVFENAPTQRTEKYHEFLSAYNNLTDGERMKSAMTDMAFFMTKSLWDERPAGSTGRLFFCIGGINSVNPFSASGIRNEVYVYSQLVPKPSQMLSTKEGCIYDIEGSACELNWTKYSEIYIDFNGSMAFWNERWLTTLSHTEVVSKVKGAFIMGGVYADQAPITAPSIPNVLNRFSSATMNQLYHPQNAADFFAFLVQYKIPAFTVTNNVVRDLTTIDETGARTYDGIESFLTANGLDGPLLKQLAKAHYTSIYNPPRKPFDYHTAIALKSMISEESHGLMSRNRLLFYSNVYGITYVSASDDTWESTRAKYVGTINTTPTPEDCPQTVTKKEYFLKEIEILKKIPYLESVPVFDLQFSLDKVTKRLELAMEPAEQCTPSEVELRKEDNAEVP